MIFNKLFTQNDIMGAALKGAEYRNQTILNNLANADTPGYKAKNIEFEPILKETLHLAKHTGELDLDNAVGRLYTQHPNFKVRLDENNVDVESEMVKFYKNTAKYDIIVNAVTSNNSRIKTVLDTVK